MKYILCYVMFFLLACYGKKINNMQGNDQNYLYGNWEEFDRKGKLLSPDIIADWKWAIDAQFLIDSSMYPVKVFKYEYILKGDTIHIGKEFFKITNLTQDTLVVYNSFLYADHYFKKVDRHTFSDTIETYYEIDLQKIKR